MGWTRLLRTQTFWLAVSGLVGVGQQWASGRLTAQQAAFAALVALLAITQRNATAKVEERLS